MARLLLDPTVPGRDGVSIYEKAPFDQLLRAQEKMSDAIPKLISDPQVIIISGKIKVKN